jgi:hypothetical protein
MKRTIAVLSILFFLVIAAWAQEPAQAQPPGKSGIPVVQFIFDWRVQNPPRYSVAIDNTGRATYRSEPSADPNGGSAPDPYQVEWTVSEATRTKVFDAARQLDYFQGKFEAKAKVAQTGMKTLTYKDSSRDNSTSYNYSENPLVRDLTRIFQAIAATAEMGRKLTHDVRYNKLGVDSDLKALEEEQKSGGAIEVLSIAPVLQQIAKDGAMFRMSQQRAKSILKAAGIPEAASSSEVSPAAQL